jgi:hypothetical protein
MESNPSPTPSLLGRVCALLAASSVGAALVVHAWHAIGSAAYVDFVTGVWLALANDFAHGVFYRDLVGPDGYGGTRYFPLFFTAIGALMRLGVSPLAAGFLVSAVAAGLLVAGIRRVLSRFGLPPAVAAALALFVLAPRFLQQGLLAIRSDLLAAGLVTWGLDFSLAAADQERTDARTLAAAAACFTLAAATKVTSLYAPAGVVLALLWAARPGAAFRLSAMVAAGVAAMMAVVAAASNGRAVESWLSCGLAGAGVAEWLASAPAVVFTQMIGPSRVFTATMLAASIAWLAMARARAPKVLLVIFPVALAATAVVLASPGTSYTNQLVDALAMGLVAIGWALSRYPGLRVPAMALLLLLSLAAARQSLMPVASPALRQQAWQKAAERESLIQQLAALEAPVLSESPELLVLGRVRPYLLDPFTLRVLSIRRPDLMAPLHGDLDARRFERVVLMYDPESPAGRGWYTNIDFGWPLMSRILANYEFAEVQAGLRVYRPVAVLPEGSERRRP